MGLITPRVSILLRAKFFKLLADMDNSDTEQTRPAEMYPSLADELVGVRGQRDSKYWTYETVKDTPSNIVQNLAEKWGLGANEVSNDDGARPDHGNSHQRKLLSFRKVVCRCAFYQ